MNEPGTPNGFTIEREFHVRRGQHGARRLKDGPRPPPPMPSGVPRAARLLALAYRWRRAVDEGRVEGYAEVARLYGMARARVSQIVALLYLAPDLQRAVLAANGTPVPEERPLRRIALMPPWADQRAAWARLRADDATRGGLAPATPSTASA
jgi:hypothetical protein